jgi:hypothetical protein
MDYMAEQILYPAQANLKMALWQADADSIRAGLKFAYSFMS